MLDHLLVCRLGLEVQNLSNTIYLIKHSKKSISNVFLPPGLFGIAGAGLPPVGGGGGPRFELPNDPCWH